MKAPNNGENILYLNGERQGLVNNCCFPSTVSSSYAPPGEVRLKLRFAICSCVLRHSFLFQFWVREMK